MSPRQFATHPSLADRIKEIASSIRRRLRSWLFDTYRPERHYMRGSGPKARALASQDQSDLPQPH